MKRRQLLQILGLTPIAGSMSHCVLASELQPGLFFYDQRFDQAISAVSAIRDAIAVDADVTTVWQQAIRPELGSKSLSVRGLTTESFHFCLKTLISDHARVQSASLERVSHDLYLWSIATQPYARMEINA